MYCGTEIEFKAKYNSTVYKYELSDSRTRYCGIVECTEVEQVEDNSLQSPSLEQLHAPNPQVAPARRHNSHLGKYVHFTTHIFFFAVSGSKQKCYADFAQ